MAVVDMIPTLDEPALKVLLANARRLETQGTAAQQKAAEAIIPVIDAELLDRESRKPPKKTPVRAKRKTAVVAKPEPETEEADTDAG